MQIIMILANGPISWFSQKQRSISLSTTESEYVAACEGVKELIWMMRLYNNLVKTKVNAILFMDNQSAIKLIRNPEFHKRTKHIDVKFHFIREKFSEKLFDLEYVPSSDQLADIFTKALSKEKFSSFKKLIGVK